MHTLLTTWIILLAAVGGSNAFHRAAMDETEWMPFRIWFGILGLALSILVIIWAIKS